MGYPISIADDAKEFVATKGYDVQFGARPLKRAIQTYIEDGLCELLLSGNLKKGDVIHVRKVETETKAIDQEGPSAAEAIAQEEPQATV